MWLPPVLQVLLSLNSTHSSISGREFVQCASFPRLLLSVCEQADPPDVLANNIYQQLVRSFRSGQDYRNNNGGGGDDHVGRRLPILQTPSHINVNMLQTYYKDYLLGFPNTWRFASLKPNCANREAPKGTVKPEGTGWTLFCESPV